jgi:hypothetical protein
MRWEKIKKIKWGWVVGFAIGVFILGWEMMALMDSEDSMMTWSRMIWIAQEAWPWFAYVAQLIPLIIVVFGVWVAVHFAARLPSLRGIFKRD